MTVTLLILAQPLWAKELRSSPEAVTDDLSITHLVYLIKDEDTLLNGIVYSPAASWEPQLIYQSPDDLTNIKIKSWPAALLIFWQKDYAGRQEGALAVSLDGGRDWGPPKFYPVTEVSLETQFAPPLPPILISPVTRTKVNVPVLVYRLPDFAPALCRVDLSTDWLFPANNTWTFQQLVSPATTEAVKFPVPVTLADSVYYCRLSSHDGLTSSRFSPITSFTIDSQAPILSSLEADRTYQNLVWRGRLNEPALVKKLNDRSFTAEADGSFALSLGLKPGPNIFTFYLSDEAGNVSYVTREVFFNPSSPEVLVNQPRPTEWHKSGATFMLEATIFDLENDFDENPDVKLTIDDQPVEPDLFYDRETDSLSGFVTLPKLLSEGRHLVSLTLTDRAKNRTQTDFFLNLDNSPPTLISQDQRCFSNSNNKIVIPFNETGAGVDPAGTLVNCAATPLLGAATVEAGQLAINLKNRLGEGTYELAVTPRDRVGNVGETSPLTLVIDTTRPELIILVSPEATTASREVTIAGLVKDRYADKVNVYGNGLLLASVKLIQPQFSVTVPLQPGHNELKVEALDQAGNQAAVVCQTIAKFQTEYTLLTNIANGPNPFNPRVENMYYTYSLSSPAELKIYLFDLTGTCLWSKILSNTTSGSTSWNGTDQFGQRLANGLYPYVITASAGGLTEIRRGKVLVFQ